MGFFSRGPEILGQITVAHDGDNNARAFLAGGGARSLFDGFREWGAPTWTFGVVARLGRKADTERFLNRQLYFTLTYLTPEEILQQDMAQSLVPLYERALVLPPPISLSALQILRVQLEFYTRQGPPTMTTIGIAPNVAVRCVFEAACDGNVSEAERTFAQYVADQFTS